MMTCFNCGRKYDDENKEKACTLIDSETGEESDIIRIILDEKTEQVLALCSYCIRAVVIGTVESSMSRRYTIKNFPYWYEKNKEDCFDGCMQNDP